MTRSADVLRDIMFAATRDRRANLSSLVYEHAQGIVMTGPFAGMKVLGRTSWGDGDIGPKILGCYEAELHPVIADWSTRPYSAVINVGCAEGYYAIGLGRIIPEIPIYAFDIDPDAQTVCLESAFANGIGDRLIVDGVCTPEILSDLLTVTDYPLLVVDCEGYEKTLIDPAEVPGFGNCDLIIELHDFIDRSISQTLVDRLRGSHDLSLVIEGGRDPNQFEALRGLPNLERWLLVDEGRPEMMSWLLASRKAG